MAGEKVPAAERVCSIFEPHTELIQRAVEQGLLSPERCWALWQQRNPEETIATGQQKTLLHLAAGNKTPLEQIQDPKEREQASQTRTWFRTRFLIKS